MFKDPFGYQGSGELGVFSLQVDHGKHAFVAACGEFPPTLEDVFDIMALALYGETNMMGLHS